MRDPIIPTRSRDAIASDNRAELDAWIEERVAALVARGMHPEEARKRAVDEFGDVEVAQRYAVRQDVAVERRVRALLWIEELGSDLRIAVRTLARTPTVTAVVLLTLALGIGATTAVFSVVHAMLLRPLPYGDEPTLVQLQPVENGVIKPAERYSVAALDALRQRTTTLAGILGAENGKAIITTGGDPEQVSAGALTPNGFALLQSRASIGRTFGTSEEASPVVVLLDGLWRRRFHGDSSILGRTIEFDDGPRQVIGVMPPEFRVPTDQSAEFLTPRDLTGLRSSADNAQVRFMRLFARVKSGVALQAAQADVDRAMRTLQVEYPQSFSGIGTRLVPIRTAVAGDARPRLLALMSAAGFVLLIACANVAGILLSRALARRHELSVRVALGAGRRRLIRQFLAEGAALAMLGAGLGILLAQLGIVALRRMALTALPPGTVFALEPSVLVFAMGAAITSAFASSLFPAFGATRVAGVALRRDDDRSSPSRASRRLSLALVAGQIAVSVVLLVGAGLFLRTLHRLSVLDLGYTTERALTFRLQFTRPRSNAEQDVFWASLYEQLRSIPGCASVGGGNVPMSGQSTLSSLRIENRLTDNRRLPEVRHSVASDDYFDALGVPIVRGRRFNPTDRDGAPLVAIVSAGLAKQFWPGGDPVGARVKVGSEQSWATVVGVVGDVRKGSAEAPEPSIYLSQRQDHWPGGGAVVIRAVGNPSTLTDAVRRAVKRVDPTLPIIGLRTLEEFRQSTPAIAERRLQMQLMSAFALIALVVSAIGVYGVGAYATEARRREFGIRMALGAPQRNVVWLALRDGANAAALGALAGIPLAWLLASRRRDMLYSVKPFDPLTVGAVLGVLFLVVCAASLVPARRATLIDPATAMRTD
jgi:predicted permease